MTDNNEHGLPERVLERAAEAMLKREHGEWPVDYLHEDYVDTYERERRKQIRAALPILRPAIEAALLQRMIVESQDWDCTSECDFSGDGEDYEAVFTRPHLAQILRTYLPTTTESEADDHE